MRKRKKNETEETLGDVEMGRKEGNRDRGSGIGVQRELRGMELAGILGVMARRGNLGNVLHLPAPLQVADKNTDNSMFPVEISIFSSFRRTLEEQ